MNEKDERRFRDVQNVTKEISPFCPLEDKKFAIKLKQ